MKINDQDFMRFVNFIQKNYGIDLNKKRHLIETRLNTTIKELGYDNFTDYVNFIINGKSVKDIEKMLNKVTTNYTYFMREKEHFSYFIKEILPSLVSRKKDRSFNIWSAGCSSGEEPYTISILLKEYLGSSASKWDTRVLATDISQRVLSAAQKGIYEKQALKDVPETWKKKYFRGVEGEKVQMSQDIRNNVIFRPFNLMDPIRFKKKFDVIFCRNVMIYFDQPTKNALTERFFDATAPSGYLLIGHSETLDKNTTPYSYIMPATYQRRA